MPKRSRRLARLMNSEYQRQKQALERMSAELGLPVRVESADYRGLMAEMPYGVRPWDRGSRGSMSGKR